MYSLYYCLWSILLIAYCEAIALIAWINVDSIQQQKAHRKKKQLEDEFCICKHMRWFHGHSSIVPANRSRCFSNSDDIYHSLCQCPGFKRDNLLYMEQLYNGR